MTTLFLCYENKYKNKNQHSLVLLYKNSTGCDIQVGLFFFHKKLHNNLKTNLERRKL